MKRKIGIKRLKRDKENNREKNKRIKEKNKERINNKKNNNKEGENKERKERKRIKSIPAVTLLKQAIAFFDFIELVLVHLLPLGLYLLLLLRI